jgi:hypothetical protein
MVIIMNVQVYILGGSNTINAHRPAHLVSQRQRTSQRIAEIAFPPDNEAMNGIPAVPDISPYHNLLSNDHRRVTTVRVICQELSFSPQNFSNHWFILLLLSDHTAHKMDIVEVGSPPDVTNAKLKWSLNQRLLPSRTIKYFDYPCVSSTVHSVAALYKLVNSKGRQ